MESKREWIKLFADTQKDTHEIIKLRCVCERVYEVWSRLAICEHISARAFRWRWEIYMGICTPSTFMAVSLFRFFLLFYRRKWASARAAWESRADKTTKRKRQRQHKLYMRIRSQTTHLNTYTWNANVPHCDRTNATFLGYPYMKKWIVVVVAVVIRRENSSVFLFVSYRSILHTFTIYRLQINSNANPSKKTRKRFAPHLSSSSHIYKKKHRNEWINGKS